MSKKNNEVRKEGYLIQVMYEDRYENMASALDMQDAEELRGYYMKECSTDAGFLCVRIRTVRLTGK